ncbi:hypothetical protein AB0F91_41550 [Amycolatopsis sp. NPDC023774]|uniref:hypothetical protein n=1 Tax=Amycolatopsis sp. NPDC023774 TaxID=3155015 RepID=UPI0033E543C2
MRLRAEQKDPNFAAKIGFHAASRVTAKPYSEGMADQVQQRPGESNAQWLNRLEALLVVHLDRVTGMSSAADDEEERIRATIAALKRGEAPTNP